MASKTNIYGVKQIDRKTRVSSTPYLYDIAEGNISDHKAWSKIGFNADVGATREIISPQGGAYVFPTAEQHMHVVSSSIEDDPVKADTNPGTGMYSLTIYYLDNDYIEKSTVVTLNGQTVVETGVSDIFRVQNVRAESWGTGAGATYKAAGNITIKDHANAVTYGYISAGQNRQRQPVWTVPAGKTLYIVQYNRSAVTAAGKSCTLALEATYDEKDNHLLAAGLAFMAYSEVTLANNVSNVVYKLPMVFPEKVDIIVVGDATASSVVQIALRGWVENA